VATAAALPAAGCGSSSSHSTAAAPPTAASGVALSADARSASTGDIPDNQVFLTFDDPRAGWSMKYPEGWTQNGVGSSVTFRDKNNLVHVSITRGHAPTVVSVSAQLRALRRTSRSLAFTQPRQVSVGGAHAIKVVYSTKSAPSQITGKRVMLVVDRYVLAGRGKVAVVDLGTPKGVDNVDAYRLMIDSFRWR
jgi:hypothetical protein